MLAARLRESDVLARLGGDEFAILLPRTDGTAAAQVASALEHDVATNPLVLDGVEIHARISIGLAVLSAEGRTDDALREADRAMYRVKQERRLGQAAARIRAQQHDRHNVQRDREVDRRRKPSSRKPKSPAGRG